MAGLGAFLYLKFCPVPALSWIYHTGRSRLRNSRDLKIVLYGKRLTSDTLFAIKTKSLTVKCITYRIYSKYRKLRIETPCLTTET